jgi:hypothetical protein
MTEPTITCPNCKIEIKLTESLAAPLIEATRKEFEKRLSQKNADIAKQESALREREDALSRDRETIDSQVLPKGIDSFDLVDGVWVTHPRAALPVAMSLRQSLLEVAAARQASEGRQTKMELVYQYLTGPRFRQRVQAIVEAFSSMQEDLDKEKKVIIKQWAKRDEQIDRVMQSTVGMYGDLQGIAGKTLQEIDGLSLDSLEAPQENLRID